MNKKRSPGKCTLPALPAELTYTQVAAGRDHTVLLRSNGTAVACGMIDGIEPDLPGGKCVLNPAVFPVGAEGAPGPAHPRWV